MPPQSKTTLTLARPELFVPAFSHGTLNNAHGSAISFTEVEETNIESSASFRYDTPGMGVRSTQQVNVDYSKFSNHTFFNSAEVNVNVAFERVINEYPFDGTKREVEAFFDGLTGFERHVYDSFPKNRGFLLFSGSTGPSVSRGTHIVVKDFAGSSVDALAKNRSGEGVIDPGQASLTFEMQLYVPAEANGNQVVCQKLSGTNQGITLSLLSSSNTALAKMLFTVASGSSVLNASASMPKARFNHVVATFDRRRGKNNLLIFVDESLKAESNAHDFGPIDFKSSDLTIGSGSLFVTSSAQSIAPTQTMSGALDEFRVFHGVRSVDQQVQYAKKSVFATDDLVLYFKFNEPTGTLGATTSDQFNRIVLDSSGNSLHSFINETGFRFSLRSTSSIPNPMTWEKFELAPVLFPNHGDVVALNTELLLSATLYDQQNPNLITKLVPQHYLQEGRVFEGLDTSDGEIGDIPTNDSLPGSSELGSAQLFATFMYVYAKFFDEMKIVTDSFSNVLKVGYDPLETTADTFLPLVAEYYGFKLPGFFSDSAVSQFIDAEDLENDVSTGTLALRYVQNQLLRRVLASLQEIIASKGTVHSVKSFFRAIGIDPDNSMRIREYGGPTRSSLRSLREKKTDTSALLVMTASSALLTSPFLSGARVEPPLSYPAASAPYVKSAVTLLKPGGATKTVEMLVSPAPSDGLFTSGSWTYEAMYRFPVGVQLTSPTQSLARFCVTGSSSVTSSLGVITNLIAISASDAAESRVKLFARPGREQLSVRSPELVMELTGTNLFDGGMWHVSFGRHRSDDSGQTVSSSYFLRAEKNDRGSVRIVAVTQSNFLEASTPASNSLQSIDASYNSLGTFITVGSQSFGTGTAATGFRFLNATDVASAEARSVRFGGRVGHVRFWSKGMTEDESEEHSRNVRSLGVTDPTANFAYRTDRSGSFGRLRLDATTDQPDDERRASAAGMLRVFDFSQNELHLVGTGFESGSLPIVPESFFVDHLSTVIDEASTTEKVRVRGFTDYANVLASPTARVSPVYELQKSEQPFDDVRFSIDFSAVDALNRDIVGLFASLDAFDDALGRPNLLFSHDYPVLTDLSDVYFNRLVDKVNVRSFQDFFKWIDTSIGLFIRQLLPSKTRFLGMNFVVENHMLERPKMEYYHVDTYMGTRQRIDANTIMLQQIVGTCKKF